MESGVFVDARSGNTVRARVSFGLSGMRDGDKVTKIEAKKPGLKRSVPTIVACDVVPRGTMNVAKLDGKTRIELSSNSFSKRILLKRNRHRSCDGGAKETGNDDTVESTSVPKERKRREACDVNESIDGSKTESSRLPSLKLDDNVHFNGENLLNGTLGSKVARGRDDSDDFAKLMSSGRFTRGETAADSERTMMDERRAVNRPDKLDINDETLANDELQICDDSGDENALSKSTARYDASRGRKPVAGNDVTDAKLSVKKIKSNVYSWLENQRFVESTEPSNVSSNGTAIDSSTACKYRGCIGANDARSSEALDLRDYLNRKKLNRTLVPTFEGKTC